MTRYNYFCDRFIWLAPVYTTDVSKAATSFDVLIQTYEDPKLDDLAKRAGGDFRYVIPRADRKLSEKIVEVGLLRTDKPLSKPPSGWQGYCINDLNKGRRKGCLYVVWKTTSTGSWCVPTFRQHVVHYNLVNDVSGLSCLSLGQ